MRTWTGRAAATAERDTVVAIVALLVAGLLLGVPSVLAVAGPVGATLAGRPTPVPTPTSWFAVAARVTARPLDPARAYAGPLAAPMPGARLYWPTATALGSLLTLAVAGVARELWRQTPPAGLASGADIERSMSGRAVRARARRIRPSLRGRIADLRAVALPIAVDRRSRRRIWVSHEDTVLIVGPPRSAKTAGLVVGALLDAPGPVVATSTRPELLQLTAAARSAGGTRPVYVFDPDGLSGRPDPIRWSPVRGCEDPARAVLRGRSLAAAAKVGAGTTDGNAWEGKAAEVLRCYLHAAAVHGASMRDVVRWAARPTDTEPVDLLRESTRGTAFWAETLAGHATADPRLVSSIWFGVTLALSCLADPRILDLCCPAPGEGFDPTELLDTGGTLYLLGTAAGQASVAPLLTALVEDVTETAKRRAAGSPGGRLDPPLHLLLDEVANIAPLPTLPQLMSDGGGSGIPTWPVVQSPAQLRGRWTKDGAEAVWDAATYKVLLPGLSTADDLEAVSRVVGERDELVRTYPAWSPMASSSTLRRVRILPPERVRMIDEMHCLILPRARPPVYGRLTPWWARPDAALLRGGTG